MNGPITAALEEELKRKIRQHRMVVWLVKQDHSAAIARRLSVGAVMFPHRVDVTNRHRAA